MAVSYAQINRQNERDLLLMESIAIPLSFAVLVWVLGGVVAATLPIVLGVLAIAGTMAARTSRARRGRRDPQWDRAARAVTSQQHPTERWPATTASDPG